ncbi:hypothetical protein AVEN_28090-1 [Araneus ventricosus]|uniref:Transposase Tc1-like domain-containing protein n=1 Tax=Araneus ventricosus TaxID=182803 RepID=A0A4Y2MY88_ARAVE|nr:hypothetical protein AVEN_28090-1 [Araneus ventricosus]
MLISVSESELKKLKFAVKLDVFLWLPEDEWKILSAGGRIEAGQSITDVGLFFGVHHSVISRLWKQFQTSQKVVRRPVAGRPRVTTPAEDRYIAVAAKRNRRSTSTRVTSMVAAAISKTISATTVRRRLQEAKEWSILPGTTSLCSFIRPIQRGKIKMAPPACELDCVLLGQRYVHR